MSSDIFMKYDIRDLLRLLYWLQFWLGSNSYGRCFQWRNACFVFAKFLWKQKRSVR